MSSAGKTYSVPSRDNNINFLRFIAASRVIWFHMASVLAIPEPYIMGQGLGPIAVNIFFVLSGYLIAKSWTRSSSFGSYLIRRIARIFPGLAVVILLSVFVMGPIVTSLPLGDYFADAEVSFFDCASSYQQCFAGSFRREPSSVCCKRVTLDSAL